MSLRPSLLLVEDDKVLRESLSSFFSQRGLDVAAASNLTEARAVASSRRVDLVLLDIHLPDGNGLDLLRELRETDESVSIVVVTAFPEVRLAVEAMKNGAVDYIIKPFELDELRLVVERAVQSRELKREVQRLRHGCPAPAGLDEIVGECPSMRLIKELIARVAAAPSTPVLIQGETGTGKEIVAEAIHRLSPRSEAPLVRVNCSAIPDGLMESELFGHERGAFTDAKTARAGLFELAEGGTVFLDEIAEMRPPVQAKLLRVVEGQPFRRLGGSREVRVDARVLAASNQDLDRMVQAGTFRADLLYRLKVVQIGLPPLRDRGDDIIRIARRILPSIASGVRSPARELSQDAVEALLAYSWPGNVRELRNVLERACILASGPALGAEHLPGAVETARRLRQLRAAAGVDGLTLRDLEREHILRTLAETGDNRTEAARKLGISRSTLKEKLKLYGIKSDPA